MSSGETYPKRLIEVDLPIKRISAHARREKSNWLPAPEGNFSIWIRAYWPDEPILDGTWKPPVIEAVK